MRDLTFRAEDFARFSVPHAVCVAGEFQYAVGQGALVAAVDLRLEVAVEETDGDFQLELSPAGAASGPALEAVSRWRQALGRLAAGSPDELDGLKVTIGQGRGAAELPVADVLRTPAAGVGLACAVRAHRGERAPCSPHELAALADALLREALGEGGAHEGRFHALSLACILGGAWHAGPAVEPLNVQLLVPPDAMILSLCPSAQARAGVEAWEKTLASALAALRLGGEKFLSAAEDDMGAFFELASRKLNEPQTAVLYGLLRMHEMTRAQVETLSSEMADHDRLAEMCDEESAILEDYFAFPAEHLKEVREVAVQSGALGAKMTYSFGERPALLVLAPGRRGEVASAIMEQFPEDVVLAVDVAAGGIA